MPHLYNRFCLVPFSDLTDCPEGGHHAIGSPYFDPIGKPLFPDPVIIIVKADITDETLPRCSALAVSCNTRPYHSYGPVMRRIFEMSQPHNYPEVRRSMEGVMEIGEVREIPPGGLKTQTDRIILGCVATMTAGTNFDILKNVLRNFSTQFSKTSLGSTLRMPLIGTGTARTEEATEKLFRQVMHLTITEFLPTLLPENVNDPSRKLLLLHPLSYEATLMAKMIEEKAIFLTILDKLGITTTDPRLVYGLGHNTTKPENCFIEDAQNLTKALDFYDQAIENLLQNKRKEALKLAAQGNEAEPFLGGMYLYLYNLITQKNGLSEAIVAEAVSLAANGRVRDAYWVSQALHSLEIKQKEILAFINNLKDCYVDACCAALESRLLYENYMKAKDALESIYICGNWECSGQGANTPVKMNLEQNDIDHFKQLDLKISSRMIENTFHIVLRKLLADDIEPAGAKRAIENLQELDKLGKITLSEQEQKICKEIFDLSTTIAQNKENYTGQGRHISILQKLDELLPKHGTLRLEAGRYYLKGDDSSNENRAITLTRRDVIKSWNQLYLGFEANPRDYGILSYLGFIIFMQGPKYLGIAEEFFTLFSKLVDYELSQGKYGIRKLKTPEKEIISVPINDPYTQQAYKYYESYRNNALTFANLARTLSRAELTASITSYKECLVGLTQIGRYDLKNLYEKILGETWVALLCRNAQLLGSISILGFEISLDLVINLYKKIRRWWKYHSLHSSQLRPKIKELLTQMDQHTFKKN